ncbi:hypothetical protein LTR62_007078 [Meristemomyces frigidus]|uniref:Dolichyl-diphosphooligosaccharide-protein glycosyltransferase subunit OST5 n=1 Tax=Meristemomyces frigidus TaxID=1508187 RepID=A0AAN7TBD4_9PEZI|nr:hypothetical protein LTR62_007078 [Meristemomyces frigidus]
MSASPLHDIWEASASQPFRPTIGKGAQFTVGFTLLLIALVLSGLFDNSLKNLPVYGIPASVAFG